MRGLVIVAHPDDESLFFGGMILTRPDVQWTVICATDGNGNGEGIARQKQFREACRDLGVKESVILKYPDVFEKPLDCDQLALDILKHAPGIWDFIYTHGPLGEYGHGHHQDVSRSTHEAFINKGPAVRSVAYCVQATEVVSMTPEVFRKKTSILIFTTEMNLQNF